jgi:hypothetical protein
MINPKLKRCRVLNLQVNTFFRDGVADFVAFVQIDFDDFGTPYFIILI